MPARRLLTRISTLATRFAVSWGLPGSGAVCDVETAMSKGVVSARGRGGEEEKYQALAGAGSAVMLFIKRLGTASVYRCRRWTSAAPLSILGLDDEFSPGDSAVSSPVWVHCHTSRPNNATDKGRESLESSTSELQSPLATPIRWHTDHTLDSPNAAGGSSRHAYACHAQRMLRSHGPKRRSAAHPSYP
ncbi:hypothetical protein COCMIDRAFT_28551 [Bipolaris oryzae ATCC 44560]|uniref:Uncharacterized protein n=1 Tax=Bipolaris oryzae ATCC 44560 TaxID=930090 RepID=W6YTZ6_COCMI|nr:uncharacterized protein COCMIDRAFT_28551 [Bipolaris oryzae ATCC 44560]EUC42927.1 hypothetical protein COCMIDRAFT_28551 [Bipolaris oryzae ATCC 44560]